MEKIIGIILLAFAVFTPISLFSGLPPFGTDQITIWTYQRISEDPIYNLPGLVYPKPEEENIVKAEVKIESPEDYRLQLIREEKVPTDGWFFGTMPIMVGCLVSGIYLICWRKEESYEKT